MTPIDVDYSAYVIAAYGVAIAMLVALSAWSVARITAARRKLTEAEKDEAQ